MIMLRPVTVQSSKNGKHHRIFGPKATAIRNTAPAEAERPHPSDAND